MMIHDSSLLSHELAQIEDSEVGDTADGVPRSQLLVSIRIHL
jgi:hypothetical protein